MDGDWRATRLVYKRQIFNIKRVQTVDFIGYSKEHQTYVFNDVAVKNGVMHRLNEEDFLMLVNYQSRA
jgi:hypothetical protein